MSYIQVFDFVKTNNAYIFIYHVNCFYCFLLGEKGRGSRKNKKYKCKIYIYISKLDQNVFFFSYLHFSNKIRSK